MESRLSMEILPKINYTKDCIEITEIVHKNLRARLAVSKLYAQGEEATPEELELFRGMASVKPVDLLMTRRVS